MTVPPHANQPRRTAAGPSGACIAFFISGHGFGHASREVEIINALAALRPDVRILVRSVVSPSLLARTVRAPYEVRPGACDSGIVQSTSIAHDDEATIREAIQFYCRFSERIDHEAAALGSDVRLIVGDIPPLAFATASRLGIPSIAIANFTWDWIYETHPGFREAAPWLVPAIRHAYGAASLALELPLSCGLGVFPAVRAIPLVARTPTRSRSDTRDHFGIPRNGRAALLSFGGYGMPALDVAAVDVGDWTLVLTDRIVSLDRRTTPGHVVYVDEARLSNSGFRYEDLVAAVDVVVTKPGFGIIAECIACQTSMLYTSRGQFREYDVLVREMPKYLRCRFIDQTDLFAGRWRAGLEAVLAQPPPPHSIATDGADVAAAIIADVLSSGAV
jgi:hypothetical protein